MIEQRVTLRYGAQQIPAIVQAVQGDTGRDVIFELADYEIPAGATANYYIDKPDGNAVYNSAEVISSTEILAHLTEQALAEPGRNNGQVRILSDGEVITSFDFVLEVMAFRGILHMQSETEVNIFDEALQDAAEDAIAEIQAQTPVVTGMQNSIAPTYSSSSTYAVGDYVMYNAQLYRCITAITTAEAWTSSHWTQIPISSDVITIFNNFNKCAMAQTGYLGSFSGDFNDFTDNQIIGFTNTNNATHSPVNGEGGTLVVIRGSMSQPASTVQLYIPQNGSDLYFRILWGTSSWTGWQKCVSNNNVSASKQGYLASFSGDFNDLADNQIIGFTNTTGATHSPVNGDGGTLAVFRGSMSQPASTIQLFIPKNGDKFYFRILWGTSSWSAWQGIGNTGIDLETQYASLSQFPNIGVIGDSYASGWVYPGGSGQNNYSLSWGQNIARRNGVECINISSGGLTTKTWLVHERGLSYLNDQPAQSLYFVALGLNDQVEITAGRYTLGDRTDYENKTDTFYGNYAKIIDAIKAKAPNAKIILCTVSEGDTTTFKPVSDAIIDIGEIESIPVINVTDDPFTTSQFFINSMYNSHPTAASYSGYALMIERQFSKCCVNYYNYFKDFYG